MEGQKEGHGGLRSGSFAEDRINVEGLVMADY